MLSSTYKELVEHRHAIQQAMLGQELFPVAMENDAAIATGNRRKMEGEIRRNCL
jgi:hypothetical protein